MKQILDAIRALEERRERGALATVVTTTGSTPRKAGAKMLVTAGGALVGTIGGGCVDAGICREALAVIQTGKPVRVTHTLTAEAAAESGMICGGTMHVFIEPVGSNGDE